jgi:hypothetical protein
MDWKNRKHQEYRQYTPGQKYAKYFLQEPSAKRTEDLLRLNRNQMRE